MISGGDPDNGTSAERVLAILANQRDEYRALKLLAEGQRALFTSSEPEKLLGVLAERRRHVERLADLNGQVKELRSRWPDIYGVMSDAQRKQADGLIREVETTLAEILAGDEQDAKLLSVRLAGTRQEAVALAESKRAYAAYGSAAARGSGAAPPSQGRFIDQPAAQA